MYRKGGGISRIPGLPRPNRGSWQVLEGPKLEIKAESEPEKTDRGEGFYFSDTTEISSNALRLLIQAPCWLWVYKLHGNLDDT